jgi:hypothetical protein
MRKSEQPLNPLAQESLLGKQNNQTAVLSNEDRPESKMAG